MLKKIIRLPLVFSAGWKSATWLVFCGVFVCLSNAFAKDDFSPLPIYIYDRPPLFIINDDNHVSGYIADSTAQIFKQAGIPFEWKILSAKAILDHIKQNTEAACAPSWYKNAKRQIYARYTLPTYRDGSRVVLRKKQNDKVSRYDSLRDLFADPQLVAGLKDGYSYGSFVDGMLNTLSPKRVSTNQDEKGMITMLLGGRFDYFMLSKEQAEYVVTTSGTSNQVEITEMSDSPPGNIRYILCSKKTDDSILQRLDDVIRKNIPDYSQE